MGGAATGGAAGAASVGWALLDDSAWGAMIAAATAAPATATPANGIAQPEVPGGAPGLLLHACAAVHDAEQRAAEQRDTGHQEPGQRAVGLGHGRELTL